MNRSHHLEAYMNVLKRWTSGVASSFEWLLRQIENHDALIESAIADVQRSAARARVQLERVKKDGAAMRQRAVELSETEDAWKQRATQEAQLDEEKAIECLRRRKRIAAQRATLEVQEREHSKTEKQLTQELLGIEQKLQELQSQKNILRVRQSRSEAAQALNLRDPMVFTEIDSILERWDEKVTTLEIQSGAALGVCDELEAAFLSREEQEALKAELHTLAAGAGD